MPRASAHHRSCATKCRAIPDSSEREPVIVATGPLTSDALSSRHRARWSAASTCISTTRSARSCSPRRSIAAKVFRASRWDRSLRVEIRRAQPFRPSRRPRTTTARSVGVRVRRRRRGGRLSELPADARRVRAVLRRARHRRVRHRPRLRQGEVLRGLPADRSDGASRPRHAAVRADEAGRPCRSADRRASRTRRCSCARTTSPAITSAWSGFRPRSNGAIRRGCCG